MSNRATSPRQACLRRRSVAPWVRPDRFSSAGRTTVALRCARAGRATCHVARMFHATCHAACPATCRLSPCSQAEVDCTSSTGVPVISFVIEQHHQKPFCVPVSPPAHMRARTLFACLYHPSHTHARAHTAQPAPAPLSTSASQISTNARSAPAIIESHTAHSGAVARLASAKRLKMVLKRRRARSTAPDYGTVL